MLIHSLMMLLFPAMMAFAASSDLFTMTISNKVALILIAGFVVMALAIGMAPTAMLMHAVAGLTVLAAAFVCFSRGWIGGGDAKFAAATALWLGFDHLLPYILYASLFGGALTLLMLQFRRLPLPVSLAGQDWVARLHHPKTGVPYGIALATSALVIYPHTIWMAL